MSRFEIDLNIIRLYLESARTYMQLSIALLGLTVAFREKILGASAFRFGSSTIICWAALLLSIGCNALYQYAAIHFLDAQSPYPAKTFLPGWLVDNPGRSYGAMVALFYVAALFFVVPALKDLFGKLSSPHPS